MKFYCLLAFLIFLLVACSTPLPKRQLAIDAVNQLLRTDNLKPIIDQLVLPLLEKKLVIGASVGVIAPGISGKIYNYGKRDIYKDDPITSDTLFQIGSITKVFTTAMLAKWAIDKRLKLTDELRQHYSYYLPMQYPDSTGRMTFKNLASHCSGFPQEVYNFKGLIGIYNFLVHGKNIWEHITPDDGMQYFFDENDIAPRQYNYSYSNVGIAMLGVFLGQKYGNGYENLMNEQMLGPLGLKDTVFHLSDEQKNRLASGHVGDLPPFQKRNQIMQPWKFVKDLTAAGGLYSSPLDLMKFLKMNMGIKKSSFTKALHVAHQKIAPAKNGYVGLSWFTKILKVSKNEITYSDGMIGGFTSFLGFNLDHKVGVFVIINNINYDDHISLELMDRMLAALERNKVLTKNKQLSFK